MLKMLPSKERTDNN